MDDNDGYSPRKDISKSWAEMEDSDEELEKEQQDGGKGHGEQNENGDIHEENEDEPEMGGNNNTNTVEMEEIDKKTFYLRYYIGHQGRYGHEFMEITLDGNGVLRYSNVSNYKKSASIQKEVSLNQIVVDEFKKMIDKSKIMETDDSQWPEPDANGKQEIEILYNGEHISFLCNKFTSSSELRNAGEDLWSFYYLTQDLKVFVFSIISLHFKVKPIPT